jgi:hypothetical protein
MHNPQIAKKVSIHFIGDKNPTKRPEVKEKIRQKALGREISEETRMKMSRNNRGRGKFGELNTNSRSIARIDKNTNEVLQVYGAFKEAERWVRENGRTSALYQNIWQACNNKKPTAYGFKWKYVEEV